MIAVYKIILFFDSCIEEFNLLLSDDYVLLEAERPVILLLFHNSCSRVLSFQHTQAV